MKESELLNPRMTISDSNFSNGGSTCIDTSYNILESLAVNDDRTTLPSSNSWSCQQNNANNAYNVVPSTGNVNNNNKTYTYAVVPVAEYEKSDDLLSLLFKAERECFKNKKKNPQGVKIHYDLKIIYQLYEQIKKYEQLLQKRNILAHVSQTKEGDTYIFKSRDSGSSDYVLTEEECLSLRKTILELSDLLNSIT